MIFGFTFISCNKNNLSEPQKKLIGTWSWIYTASYDENCYSTGSAIQHNYDTVLPNKQLDFTMESVEFINRDYQIRIFESKKLQKMEFFLDDDGSPVTSQKDKSKLEIYSLYHIVQGSPYYRFGEEYNFNASFGSGVYYNDTLVLTDYPIEYLTCAYYIHNYFVRI